MTLTITRDEFARFAPDARTVYVDTLFANLDILADADILANKFRLAHWFAQVYAETGGFTILRESMAYRPARARQVWPARFRNVSDADLGRLCADPVKFADAVYGGRMGNRRGTSDGYDYRGGMWLQTTGRYAVEKYCKQIGVEAGPQTLDDPVVTLLMAAFEWRESGCNGWADKNDILRVSKVINVGSAESGVMPNGMEHRREGLRRALNVWGNAQHLAAVADVKASDLQSRTIQDAQAMQKAGVATTVTTVAGAAAKAVQEANVPAVPLPAPPAVDLALLKQTTEGVGFAQKLMEGGAGIAKFAVTHWWIAGIVLGLLLWWYGRRIVGWYLEDIRTGKRQPVFKATKAIAQALAP